MTNQISLFSGYEQNENRTTNYCLLILKMIYEEAPVYLGEALSVMLGDEKMIDFVGVKFNQQQKIRSSIPDGLIIQSPFSIFIETKNYDWFYDAQLESHLDGLDKEYSGRKILIALGSFDEDEKDRFKKIINVCEEKYKGKIKFYALSFERFLESLQSLRLPKGLEDLAGELRGYMDEQKLLPSWKNKLDVVNCAGIPEDIIDHNVYMCPATSGAYSHQRCKYFGMYKDKTVSKVALIKAVVDVESDSSSEIKWINLQSDNDNYRDAAIRLVSEVRGEYPTRIFLLDKLFDTNFVKDSSGGLMGSKKYFDISSLEIKDSQDLAEKLSGMKWSEFTEE